MEKKLTGSDIKNIRNVLKLSPKEFAKKISLVSSRSEAVVYQLENNALEISQAIIKNIRNVYIKLQVTATMEAIREAILKANTVPQKIAISRYPDENTYSYFFAKERVPYWLFLEVDKEVNTFIKELGISVVYTDMVISNFEKWLQKKNLQNTPENRALFAASNA